MIRYPVTRKQLLAEIEAASPGWTARALRNPKRGIWNQIREVYTRLQHGKCAYCERLLSDPQHVQPGHGRPVDHFRPKSLYPLLAHEPFNYAIACVDCNSALKMAEFPVDATRRRREADLRKLKAEKPLLIYPIGPVDENPESLITFHGFNAMALAKKGYRRRRAEVTLQLFHTGPEERYTRRELLTERACQICSVWWNRQRGGPDLESPHHAHAGCRRAFAKLCKTAPHAAKVLYELADEFLHPKVTVKAPARQGGK